MEADQKGILRSANRPLQIKASFYGSAELNRQAANNPMPVSEFAQAMK
jgi:hypothetical protein